MQNDKRNPLPNTLAGTCSKKLGKFGIKMLGFFVELLVKTQIEISLHFRKRIFLNSREVNFQIREGRIEITKSGGLEPYYNHRYRENN